MGLQKLLFELSSNERISIITELQRRRLKLSHVSRELGVTVTEASRHLQRLSDVNLIRKDSEGFYELTSFGVLALTQLSGLDFAAKYVDYFLEHDVSSIPYEFTNRIGELIGANPGNDVFKNIEEAERRFREAREFIWIISDQVLASPIPAIAEKLKAPFDLRIIFPEAIMPTDGTAPIPSTAPGVQKRVLPKVNVLIGVTEKAAGVCLPNKSGRLDYTGFIGQDAKFHKWCKDLFLFYWGKAKTIGFV